MIYLEVALVNDSIVDTILVYALITGLIVFAVLMIIKCILSFIKLNNFKSKKQEEIETFEEPPLTEISATLVSKECLVKTYGIKYPETKQEFYFVFETDDKNLLRYRVEENEYHLYNENQKGTIALVNENYYGFCVDE